MTKVSLQPSDLPKPANYSLGVSASGRQIYVSGLVPVGSDGKTVGVGDIKAQTRQVFANIEKVLVEAGASRSDIVKITVYLTDLKNFAGMSEVRTEFFSAPFPASAAIRADLINPEWLIEIDAIAVV